MARRSKTIGRPFFLRKQVDGGTAATGYQQSEIDISSFVNVLQGEVLRVKQAWVEWNSDAGGPIQAADLGSNTGASCDLQITSESQTDRVPLTNNSVIAKNTVYANCNASTDIDFYAQGFGMNPIDYDDGYLVATDSIFLGINESGNPFANTIRASMMLECEIAKLSLSDAQAVLVSQTLG